MREQKAHRMDQHSSSELEELATSELAVDTIHNAICRPIRLIFWIVSGITLTISVMMLVVTEDHHDAPLQNTVNAVSWWEAGIAVLYNICTVVNTITIERSWHALGGACKVTLHTIITTIITVSGWVLFRLWIERYDNFTDKTVIIYELVPLILSQLTIFPAIIVRLVSVCTENTNGFHRLPRHRHKTVSEITLVIHNGPSTETCGICMVEIGDEMIGLLPCDHEYHEPCIRRWLSTKSTCPLCREEYPNALIIPHCMSVRPDTDVRVGITQ